MTDRRTFLRRAIAAFAQMAGQTWRFGKNFFFRMRRPPAHEPPRKFTFASGVLGLTHVSVDLGVVAPWVFVTEPNGLNAKHLKCESGHLELSAAALAVFTTRASTEPCTVSAAHSSQIQLRLLSESCGDSDVLDLFGGTARGRPRRRTASCLFVCALFWPYFCRHKRHLPMSCRGLTPGQLGRRAARPLCCAMNVSLAPSFNWGRHGLISWYRSEMWLVELVFRRVICCPGQPTATVA